MPDINDQNTHSNMSWQAAEALEESDNSFNISNFGTSNSDDLIVAVFK